MSRDHAADHFPITVSRQTRIPPEVAAPGRLLRSPLQCRLVVTALRVAFLGLLLPVARAAAQHPLVSLPADDPAYDVLLGLERTGCAVARVSAYRPYLVRDVRAAVQKAVADPTCAPSLVARLRSRFAADTSYDIFSDNEGIFTGGGVLTVRATGLSNGEFRPLWRGIRPSDEGDPPITATARAGLLWGSDNVAAVAQVIGYSHRQNDPSLHQRAVRRTSGALDFGDSYINAQLGRFLTLSFGRANEAWLGEGRESLSLSSWGPSLDRLVLAGRWRRVEARALLASISSVELTPELDSLPGTTARRYYRQFIAHALTVRPTNAMELSVGETVLLARGTQTLELAYANPFMAYLVTQNDTSRANAGQNDNLQIFGSLRLHSGGSALQAELLVDDVQIDSKDRQRVQDQLAWSVRGSQSLPLIFPASAVAEYRHVNSYTYIRNYYATAYQSYDSPLGSELGPDADLWRVGGELWPSGAIRASAGFGMWRQGAQRLDQRPGRDANNHAGEPFPSVTLDRPYVQRALLADGAIAWLGHPLSLTLRVEGSRVQHPANQLAATASYVRMQLTGRYAYHIP